MSIWAVAPVKAVEVGKLPGFGPCVCVFSCMMLCCWVACCLFRVTACLQLLVALAYPWAFRVIVAGCNMRWRCIQLCFSF